MLHSQQGSDSRTDLDAFISLCAHPSLQALEHAETLFQAADTNKDGTLSLGELRDVLMKASNEFSHLEEHARFLDRCGTGRGRLSCHGVRTPVFTQMGG